MYYTGTEIQCEIYNDTVTQGQNYKGTTTRWSAVEKHYSQDLYAIKVNENYPSNLPTIDNLDGWSNPELYV